MTTASTATSSFDPAPAGNRWRTVDIVVTAMLGVAFGVVFYGWGLIHSALYPTFGPAAPALYLFSGIWLLPAVIAPLIVRKPGAAIFAEVAAASVSAVLGSFWGLDAVLSGFVQGAGAELVFAFALYRRWTLPVAALAGLGAAVGEALHDLTVYRELFNTVELQVATAVAMLLSGLLVAGVGGWLLVRTLRQTGVLETFPSDR
jgi:energy-coupling factor transport system substrate-specific component